MLSCLVIANVVVAGDDPAWLGHHPLTQVRAGDVLLLELRCHSGLERGSLPERTAPDLTAVGARITKRSTSTDNASSSENNSD